MNVEDTTTGSRPNCDTPQGCHGRLYSSDTTSSTTMSSKFWSGEVCPDGSVRRCLFERPDVDATRRDLERALTQLRRQSALTWNFDFERARPLAAAAGGGPIVWTRDGEGRVWIGKICDRDIEEARRCTGSSIGALSIAASTQQSPAFVRGCPERRQRHRVDLAAAGRGVMKSSRLTQRRRQLRRPRQSRVTGWGLVLSRRVQTSEQQK